MSNDRSIKGFPGACVHETLAQPSTKRENKKPRLDAPLTHVIFATGQMIWMTSISHMIFIGSPRLSSLNEMMERKMYLSDIPLYDVTRELVLLNQQRIAEIEVRYVSLCMTSHENWFYSTNRG